MKKLLLTTLLTAASINTYAFEVNLSKTGIMSISSLVEMGAEYVKCSNEKPKCILQGYKFGIQYPGQKIEDVELVSMTTLSAARNRLLDYKEDGFCE